MAFEIIGTGRSVPPRRVTNDELPKELDTSDEWIRSHTGIGARHIAGEETATSDLGLAAAKEALAMVAGPGADEKALEEAALSLDFIVLATVTPDFMATPATACIIQDKLGAKRAGAMDLSAGCTGFVYALETAVGLLAVSDDRKRALVIGAEVLTRLADWTDRGTCVLFGDGAGAVVVEKTSAPREGQGKRGVIRTILKADGSGAEHLVCRRGAGRSPYKTGEVIDKPPYIEMNGQAVYNFAVKAITDTVGEIFVKEGIGVQDVAYIIPHQANAG